MLASNKVDICDNRNNMVSGVKNHQKHHIIFFAPDSPSNGFL